MGQTKVHTKLKTKLQGMSARSAREESSQFNWLMQHFSVENLADCFHSLNGKKAVGIDGITKQEYGTNLIEHLTVLVERLKTFDYRPKTIRRVKIPKSNGKTRPLGISALEDKIIQEMSNRLLTAIYEPTFKNCSFGFRVEGNCHTAIKALHDELFTRWHVYVLEIDFENFFGTLVHDKLIEFLRIRIKDENFIRLMTRMLRTATDTKDGACRNQIGLVQGSLCSPVLANLFAHHVLDVWFEDVVQDHLSKSSKMVRYCDDAVFVFSDRNDALRFHKALRARCAKFSLKLNEDKTRLLSIDKWAYQQGFKQPTFNFLGFTFYVGRTRANRIHFKLKTERKRMITKLKAINQWLKAKRHRHSMRELWGALSRIILGYNEYFAISFNGNSVRSFSYQCLRIFLKWINRRSQRKSITWNDFLKFIEKYSPPVTRTKRLLF